MPTLTRAKKILIVLCALAVVLSALLIYVLMTSPTTSTTDTSAFEEEPLLVRPDIERMIPLIFDVESEVLWYDWALSLGDDGAEQLTETSNMVIDGQAYDFLLTTRKADTADADFTIVDYLTLTLTAVDAQGVENELVFVDLGGDGNLDSVYLNDVAQTSPESMIEAQNQYALELFITRDYLLGL